MAVELDAAYCDYTADGRCDASDRRVIEAAINGPHDPVFDFDHNGVINTVDVGAWQILADELNSHEGPCGWLYFVVVDFNFDGLVDCDDVDSLVTEIVSGFVIPALRRIRVSWLCGDSGSRAIPVPFPSVSRRYPV